MTACMGGWCQKRERCERYHERSAAPPRERICERGADGVEVVQASEGGTVRRYILADRSVREAAAEQQP